MRLTTSLSASLLMIIGLPLAVMAAETPQNVGPDIIKLKMGNKILNFQHQKHQRYTNNECFHCHKPQEWKIKKWDKEVAHQICISCHDLDDKGPVECNGCHTTK
jgi:predicted CXXCH cytochrome family protein